MSKSKPFHHRLPPLLSVNPAEHRNASASTRSSKYHQNCCASSKDLSPGRGSFLFNAPSRRAASRQVKSSKSTSSILHSRCHESPRKVFSYLQKHADLLERFVLENVSLEVLERWVIRKTHQRQSRQNGDSLNAKETLKSESTSLSKWKISVHADKREMLQELTSMLLVHPNKALVLSELARNIAAAVNASGWRLFIYNPDSKELSTFENEEKRDKSYDFGSSLRSYVITTKKNARLNSSNKGEFLDVNASSKCEKDVCILCHPILQPDGELSGVLELYKDAGRGEFQIEDEEVVNSYLVWAGIALHYAELFCTMIQQKELNSFLLTVVKSIFQDMVSMDTVILKIMMFARKLVNADRASLFLVDGKSSELYARIFDINGTESEDMKKETDHSTEEIRFPIGKGIAGYVAMSGTSLNISDAYKDPRFNRDVDQRTGYSTKNILCMPIFIRGTVIGVVQMVNKTSGPFTKSDEEAFATFAIYCGLALHHAKLYDKIRRSEQKHKLALDILSYHNTCSEDEIKSIEETKLSIETEALNDFNFNSSLLTSDEKVAAAIVMLKDLPKVESCAQIDQESLVRFTLTVRKNYRRVPYHNWTHGFSVANSAYILLKQTDVFRPLEELSLFVSCLCHDLDHRGKTNQFLIHSASPLAAMYSTSVLEHHHFNMTVSILQQEGHNIFKNLSSTDYKKVLNNVKHCILATDLALFFPNMAKLKDIVNSNKFDWKQDDHRLLLQAISMTACDLCASTKSWDQQKKIVKAIFEEFYEQGDIERSLGKEPIPIMDRSKENEQPLMQVGFLKGICIPCYNLLYALIPQVEPMIEGCKSNLRNWQDIQDLKK